MTKPNCVSMSFGINNTSGIGKLVENDFYPKLQIQVLSVGLVRPLYIYIYIFYIACHIYMLDALRGNNGYHVVLLYIYKSYKI